MNSNTKKAVILCVALAVIAAGMWFLYSSVSPSMSTGEKTITVDIITDAFTEAYTIKTSEATLGAALEKENLIEGEKSTYGLFIKSANGITADEGKQQWWCITKDGDDVNTGADSTPIADGDKFELTLKTGY